MKILWIINRPFGLHEELMGKESRPGSGGWYNATYEILKKDKDFELHIVALSDVDTIISKSDKYGNVFYLIPGKYTQKDKDYNSKYNKSLWKELRNIVKPDIIQLWGTEYQHGICALEQFKDLPEIVYMQGVMTEIGHYYKAGIEDRTIKRFQTLRSAILKRDSIFSQQQAFLRMAKIEEKILKLAKNVIVENDWCEGICSTIIGKDAKVFRNHLPINKLFEEHKWSSSDYKPHTIFTNASGYCIKGHHILFEALPYVIEQFPDVKVRIPGNEYITSKGILSSIKRSDYTNYIRNLIKVNHLEEHIEWMGPMKQEDMANVMSKSNIYVMCSSIENHSSSLIEAMIMGMPCISSFVGGVNSFAIDKRNCLLYRFDDSRTLAALIIKLFKDKNLCHNLSIEATKISEARQTDKLKDELTLIYNELITKSNII